MYSRLAHYVLETIYPERCELCDVAIERTRLTPGLPTPQPPLCQWCEEDLIRVEDVCLSCGGTAESGGYCGRCPQEQPRLLTALYHEGSAQKLVYDLKFSRSLRAARILSHVLAATVTKAYTPDILPGVLIPVPLSWRARVRRAYNQADWLAYYTQKAVQAQWGPHCELTPHYRIVSRRHGPSQRSLNRRERLALSSSAFRIRAGVQHHIDNAHVAVIDDVHTTGATTKALATALTKAGARRVDVWCATKVDAR